MGKPVKSYLNQELSLRQRTAIAIIATEPVRKIALERASICAVTFYKWAKEPLFSEALLDAENELVKSALSKAKHLVMRAVDTMGDLLDSEKENIRLQAADKILNLVNRAQQENTGNFSALGAVPQATKFEIIKKAKVEVREIVQDAEVIEVKDADDGPEIPADGIPS